MTKSESTCVNDATIVPAENRNFLISTYPISLLTNLLNPLLMELSIHVEAWLFALHIPLQEVNPRRSNQ